MMKKFMYILGTIAPILLIIVAFFKLQHWPWDNMALLGSVLMVVAVFIPILVRHTLKDKEHQMQNFSILIFVLAFMAVNIMVFAIRVSKNVLHSMHVSAKENIMTSRLLAKENSLVLQAAQMDSTISANSLDQADLIHNQTAELDKYPGNLGMVFHLDNHNSTESVIFGSELEK